MGGNLGWGEDCVRQNGRFWMRMYDGWMDYVCGLTKALQVRRVGVGGFVILHRVLERLVIFGSFVDPWRLDIWGYGPSD